MSICGTWESRERRHTDRKHKQSDDQSRSVKLSVNSSQFILYSPISQITNSPPRALQSVRIRHPWPLTSHRIRKKSQITEKNRENSEEENNRGGSLSRMDRSNRCHVTRWTALQLHKHIQRIWHVGYKRPSQFADPHHRCDRLCRCRPRIPSNVRQSEHVGWSGVFHPMFTSCRSWRNAQYSDWLVYYVSTESRGDRAEKTQRATQEMGESVVSLRSELVSGTRIVRNTQHTTQGGKSAKSVSFCLHSYRYSLLHSTVVIFQYWLSLCGLNTFRGSSPACCWCVCVCVCVWVQGYLQNVCVIGLRKCLLSTRDRRNT